MDSTLQTEPLNYQPRIRNLSEEERAQFAWLPQEGPQEAAWQAERVFEILYGGARGGGKSDYLLGTFLSHAAKYTRAANGIIFRKTYKQLDEIVRRGKELYCQNGYARFAKGEMTFVFEHPELEGAQLKLRYLETLADAENYQGHQYSFIGFDEIVNFNDWEIVERLRACARSAHPGDIPIIRYTANPGGRLHSQVKAYFIDPAPKGFQIIKNEQGRTRMFIPSKLSDNQYLDKNNPQYRATLEAIKDEALRKAWLDGDWTVTLGSFFSHAWDPKKHVIPRIPARFIPEYIPRYRAFDWGSAKPFAVLWYFIADGEFAIHKRPIPKGSIVIYREIYGCARTAGGGWDYDTGLKLSSPEVARIIKKTEEDAGEANKIRPGPADNAIWSKHDGPTIADQMQKEGITFIRSHKAREIGFEQVLSRLRGYDAPLLYITEDCVHLIRTLPELQRSEINYNDIADGQDDHLAGDTLRYICHAYQMVPRSSEDLEKIKQSDQHSPIDPLFGT